MNKRSGYNLYFLLWGFVAVLASCSNSSTDKTNTTKPAINKVPAMMAPFRYHKTIEVAPGQYYDILSWGRGSVIMGAFEILRSDSAGMKYTTTTGDLEGKIIDVLNSDMDTDGNPEIFIHTQAVDSTNYATVYGFEYNDNQARKLDFPKLTRSQRKGYRGNDNIFIKDGYLMREFNVYSDSDSVAAKPIEKRLIKYDLRSNSIIAEVVKQDTSSKEEQSKQPEPVAATHPKAEKKKSTSSSHSSAKRSVSKKSSRKKQSSSRKKQTSHKRRSHR